MSPMDLPNACVISLEEHHLEYVKFVSIPNVFVFRLGNKEKYAEKSAATRHCKSKHPIKLPMLEWYHSARSFKCHIKTFKFLMNTINTVL